MISENGSTDRTLEIGQRLARKYPKVKILHVDQAGVGYALRNAWTKCDCEILSYVDADLPFRLDDLKAVCAKVADGYDIAIGSRYVDGGMNDVPRLRKLLSVLYNNYRKVLFGSSFSDHCGIRAIKRKVFLSLEPSIRSNGWFFGTELLLLAERRGHSIKEVPVQAREDPTRVTKMRIIRTILDYLHLSLKLRFEFMIEGRFSDPKRQPR